MRANIANKRLISLLTIIILLFTIIPLTAFAQDTIVLNPIEDTKLGSDITISGSTTLNGATVKILRPNNTVLYTDTIEGNFNKTITIPADGSTGTYTVAAGKGTQVKTVTFEVTKPSSGGESSGSSGGGGGGGSSTTVNTTKVKANESASIKAQGVNIEIPSNAFNNDITVKVEKVKNISKLPTNQKTKLVSDVFEITKNEKGSFNKKVTITLPFNKDEVDLDKYDLGIFWLDEEANKWIKLDKVKVDTKDGKVSGDVDHFTKFAVFAIEKEPTTPTTPETTTLKNIKGHWAEKQITKLVDLDAINGYPDNTFKPNNNITRAEFATVLVKALKLEQKGNKVFADTVNHWAKDFIATACEYGIVNGIGNNKFAPNALITREQMAVMAAKSVNLSANKNAKTFADEAEISSWAKEAVKAASSNDIINGYSNGKFEPKQNATRAEAATIIVRLLDFKDTADTKPKEDESVEKKPTEQTEPESKPAEQEESSQQPDTNIITIEGSAVATPKIFSLSDLKAMTEGIVSATYFSRGKDTSPNPRAHTKCTGISLQYLLEEQIDLKKTPSTVTVIAEDGYRQRFSIDEVKSYYMDETDPNNNKLKMIIAWEEDGKQYDPKDGAPFRLIMGQKFAEEYNRLKWVRNVIKIEVD